MELRHTCLSCGGSCRGARVTLLAEERARIEDLAARLGVPEPVVDGRLRVVDDACVFATAEGLCAIHREFGASAKPAICAQYPLVALRVGEQRRIGIDPGCYTAFRTWRTGERLEPAHMLMSSGSPDPGLVQLEAMLLGLLAAQGWRGLLVGLVRPGFESRWIAALNTLRLSELLARPGTSRDQSAGLAALATALPGWTEPPSSTPLDPELDAWVTEVVRRMIHLRLAAGVPTPAAVALLVAGGALALSWVDPRPECFAPALAAWARAVRTPQVWAKLLPSPEALKALAAGG